MDCLSKNNLIYAKEEYPLYLWDYFCSYSYGVREAPWITTLSCTVGPRMGLNQLELIRSFPRSFQRGLKNELSIFPRVAVEGGSQGSGTIDSLVFPHREEACLKGKIERDKQRGAFTLSLIHSIDDTFHTTVY